MRRTPSPRHALRRFEASESKVSRRTGTVAQSAPSLPMTIAISVQAIIGLQPFCHAQKHRARTSNKSLTAAPFVSATYSWSCVPGVTAGSLTDGGRGEGRETLQRVATEGP